MLSHHSSWDMKHLGQRLALEEEDPLRRKGHGRERLRRRQGGSARGRDQLAADKPYLKVYALHSHTTQLLASCHSCLPSLPSVLARPRALMKAPHHPHLSIQPALCTPSPPPHSWAGHLAGASPCLQPPLGPFLQVLLCLITCNKAQIIS